MLALGSAERDRREAADTRIEAERWLNDPPPGRSALAKARDISGRTIMGRPENDEKAPLIVSRVKPG
jgi:hypothetical protein